MYSRDIRLPGGPATYRVMNGTIISLIHSLVQTQAFAHQTMGVIIFSKICYALRVGYRHVYRYGTYMHNGVYGIQDGGGRQELSVVTNR